MQLQIREMQTAIYSLYPNDKVDGYRRLVRMLNQMRDLGKPVILTPTPSIQMLKEPGVVERPIKELEGRKDLLQEFILLQHAYELAKTIKNMRNQLICTSDSVRLLARYCGHELAQEYFEVRVAEIGTDKQRAYDYRMSRMIGKSWIEIGLSILDKLRKSGEESGKKVEEDRKNAANLLKEGFRIIQFRSKHDWFVLRQHIDALEESCDSLGDELAGLYGALRQLQLGPIWFEWLKVIDDKANSRFLID